MNMIPAYLEQPDTEHHVSKNDYVQLKHWKLYHDQQVSWLWQSLPHLLSQQMKCEAGQRKINTLQGIM